MAQFGSFPTLQPRDQKVTAEAEFQAFAPCPCSCLGCLVAPLQQQRMYARVYDSKFEINTPLAPMACLTVNENCVIDMISVKYFDRMPTRSPMACFCIPLNCCGPPVLFSKSPKCLCLDLTPYFGQSISAAPCTCMNLKMYLCCGNPCYTSFALPVVGGLKDAQTFLGHWKGAMIKFEEKHPELKGQLAVFQDVSDNIGDFGGGGKEIKMER